MTWRARIYTLHRWIGLLVCLQLLAWSVGGLVFSVLDIRAVRGETDSPMMPYRPLDEASILQGLRDEAASAVLAMGERAAHLALVDRGLGARWEIRDQTGDLVTCLLADGSAAPMVNREQAERLALDDFTPPARPLEAVLIEANPPIEYRAKPLPAWRVVLDHPRRPHIYVDARTGEISARRNRAWRIFDFFWMLHTMDYAGRDDFNHPLLTVASLLAIATAASGLSLWLWRFATRISRHRRRRQHAIV